MCTQASQSATSEALDCYACLSLNFFVAQQGRPTFLHIAEMPYK